MYKLNPTKGGDEDVQERLMVYMPSRQVDDRHELMLASTPHWYHLNKCELLQTSQPSDLKKPNGS